MDAAFVASIIFFLYAVIKETIAEWKNGMF